MKSSLLRGTLKWGATYAGINLAMALLLPMPFPLDAQVALIISLVVGFIGGIALQIMNFLASEAVSFIEYQLTKVEGLPWSNHNAVRRKHSMTACGLWSAGFFLALFIVGTVIAATNPAGGWAGGDEELFAMTILLPVILPVFGFGFGVLGYFIYWGVRPILDFLFYLAGVAYRTLMQFYKKWKHHDYRS